jgi:carbon-monoxide dehydrogenase medium subunit
MRRFALLEPLSLPAAIAALEADPAARPIAGGTALLVLIKQGVYLPETLVSLRRIGGLADIAAAPDGGLRIGALATIGEVERHPLVRTGYPVLAEACHVVANVRIRNLATIGGNLAHADYQSDPPAALLAIGARVELTDAAGARTVELSDLLLGAYETSLGPAELVTAVLLPAPAPGWQGAYLRFTTGSSEERPAVGVAALVRLADGRCTDARLVVGAVGPAPARMTAAESLLRDTPVDAGRIGEVGRAVAEAVEPIDDLRGSARYKRRIAGVIAERALERSLAAGPAG